MPNGWNGSKPDEDFWIKQVQLGMRFRRERAKQDEWNKWRRWYRGDWQRGTLPTNIYFKMIRTIVPRVYYRNPSVSVTPTMPGMEHMLLAKLIERADNKLIDTMGVKKQMKTAVQLGVMFGTSIPKLGYGARYTPTPNPIDTSRPDVGGRRMREHTEYNSLVQPNRPWFLNCHPGSIVFPDKCAQFEEARWICHETFMSIDDLRSDPRFKNTKDLAESTGNSISFSGSASRTTQGVILWEIRDKKTGQVFVMAPYGDTGKKVLLQAEDELQIDGGLPFYPLVFNTDDESVWGVPDSQILAPQQQEINETRTLMMYHRRIAIAKMLYQEGAIEPDELSKLIDGNVNAAIKVKDVNGIKPLDPSPIPTGLLESAKITAQDVQELMGLGVNQFGEYAPGSADRSATEANIVNQATQIRIDERRDTCADLLTAFVNDMHHVIMKQWSGDMVENVIGPAGVDIWIKFSPEMLRDGHWMVKVDPDTSLPQTKQLREQKAVQVFTALRNDPFIDQQALRAFLLNEMYGVYADSLMLNPLMNTSRENPMDLRTAIGHMQSLPAPMAGKLPLPVDPNLIPV